MLELQSVNNLKGKVSWVPGNYTVRELIPLQNKHEGKQLFILVTKTWVTDALQDTFVLQF